MFYVLMYLGAAIAANLIIAATGPQWWAVGGVCLAFVAFNLTSRDRLHDAWQGRGLWRKMALLIGAGSALSWFLNRGAGRVSLASFLAFALAGLADMLIYHTMGNAPPMMRVNLSNAGGAAVDSLVFMIVAFGWPPLWGLALLQFVCKVGGGFVYSLCLPVDKTR